RKSTRHPPFHNGTFVTNKKEEELEDLLFRVHLPPLQLKLDCNYKIHLFFFILEMSHGEGENHAKLDEKNPRASVFASPKDARESHNVG
ncbi:MAG: hypothetical protein LW850_10825, partial [Planctomycetaceae bacterium]|nr:hypothetical protein [Planctomycetaceae bacterium]